MTNALATLTIVTILEIVDTRDGELVEDANGRERWVPIPGSGNAAECARCGRRHEVHATVELSDGTTRVMGTGCAKQLDASQASRISSEERRAKARTSTRGALTALRAKLAEIEARNAAAEAEVEALGAPAVVQIPSPYGADERTWYQCGDANPCAGFRGDETIAQNNARRAWRDAALRARGWKSPRAVRAGVEALEKKLAKLDAAAGR